MKGKICQYLFFFKKKKITYDVSDLYFCSSARMNEKHSIMTPFDITSKILGPYVFSATSRETLGEKMEYYFQDHSFMPLFIQARFTLPLEIYVD